MLETQAFLGTLGAKRFALARLLPPFFVAARFAGRFADFFAAIPFTPFALGVNPSASWSLLQTSPRRSFLASPQLGEVDRIRPGGADPAVERVLHDQDLHRARDLVSVEVEDVGMLLGVILTESAPAETTCTQGALAAMPAIHVNAPTRESARGWARVYLAGTTWLAPCRTLFAGARARGSASRRGRLPCAALR